VRQPRKEKRGVATLVPQCAVCLLTAPILAFALGAPPAPPRRPRRPPAGPSGRWGPAGDSDGWDPAMLAPVAGWRPN